ncbi:MAG: peptidylprolyl isomerase [Neisseria animaloris]|uniref:peptidylprolyl isomerase n=1 Tax=Neisseria animaloris TaxID=326522 RepID=UPI000D301696|nr:peptidylprolyl isomerase [Neisseria animaloris]MDO5072839.1 peptidylprolyl isomerase [Neisseria animaloris]
MNCKSLILAATLGLALQTAQASDVKLVDGIAAIAGTEAITHRDVRQGIAEARRNLPKGSQISNEELRQQVLQQLINQSLIVQAGRLRNINASDAEIDETLALIAQSRKTTIDGLYAQSAKIGVSKAAMRRSIADSIIAQKVQQQAIMQNSRVSDAEVDNLLARAKEQGIALPEGKPMRQYRAQHILLKGESSNALAAAESGIRKIYNQARSGTDFASLARRFSQDGSAAAGGDLGWFGEGHMVPEFEDAVKALNPGQISRPIRTQFGWHVIKLNEVREAGTPEEQQREAVRQYIAQQKVEQATANLLQELHANSFVEIR